MKRIQKIIAVVIALSIPGATFPAAPERPQAPQKPAQPRGKAPGPQQTTQESPGEVARQIYLTQKKTKPLIERYVREVVEAESLFPGTIERGIKKQLVSARTAVITPEQQDIFVDVADLLGRKFTPQKEVILDLSNQMIKSVKEVDYHIEIERNKLQSSISDKQNKVKAAQRNVDLAKQYKVPSELRESEQELEKQEQEIATLQTSLDNLRNENITILLLGRNLIERLPEEAFNSYPNLKVIDLSSNKLTGDDAIRPLAFAGLKRLEVLALADQNLEFITPLAFTDNKNLQLLHIGQTVLAGRLKAQFAAAGKKAQDNIRAIQKKVPRAYIVATGMSRSAFIRLIKIAALEVTALLVIIIAYNPTASVFISTALELMGIRLQKGKVATNIIKIMLYLIIPYIGLEVAAR